MAPGRILETEAFALDRLGEAVRFLLTNAAGHDKVMLNIYKKHHDSKSLSTTGTAKLSRYPCHLEMRICAGGTFSELST